MSTYHELLPNPSLSTQPKSPAEGSSTKQGVETGTSVYLLLAFSILFTVFLIGPPLLSMPFGPYPLMKVGDVFDLLTPFVLIVVYWRLFQPDASKPASPGQTLAFLVLAAFWVQGQGMHLAANSIGHLLKGTPGADSYALTYFYDEVLSHYLWHIGVMGLSALLLIRYWDHRVEGKPAGLTIPVIAAVIYAITFTLIIMEGGTTLIGIPFALVVALFGLIRGRDRMRNEPLLALFFIGYLVSILVLFGWWMYWGPRTPCEVFHC